MPLCGVVVSPGPLNPANAMPHERFQACLTECVRCAQECEQCATACLSGPDVKAMAARIRLDQDCAAVCWLAASFLCQRSEFDTDVCRLCATVCNARMRVVGVPRRVAGSRKSSDRLYSASAITRFDRTRGVYSHGQTAIIRRR